MRDLDFFRFQMKMEWRKNAFSDRQTGNDAGEIGKYCRLLKSLSAISIVDSAYGLWLWCWFCTVNFTATLNIPIIRFSAIVLHIRSDKMYDDASAKSIYFWIKASLYARELTTYFRPTAHCTEPACHSNWKCIDLLTCVPCRWRRHQWG